MKATHSFHHPPLEKYPISLTRRICLVSRNLTSCFPCASSFLWELASLLRRKAYGPGGGGSNTSYVRTWWDVVCDTISLATPLGRHLNIMSKNTSIFSFSGRVLVEDTCRRMCRLWHTFPFMTKPCFRARRKRDRPKKKRQPADDGYSWPPRSNRRSQPASLPLLTPNRPVFPLHHSSDGMHPNPQPLPCVLCRLIRRLWAVAAVSRVGRDIFILLFTLSLSGNPRLRSDWWAKATKTVGDLTFQPNLGRTRPMYSDSKGCAR